MSDVKDTTETPWEEMTPKEKKAYIRKRSSDIGGAMMAAEVDGDKEAILKFKSELDELESLMGEDDSLKSIATEGYEIGFTESLERDTTIEDAQKKKIKTLVTGNLLSDAVKTGIGIFQAIDGAAKKKGLAAPKLPQNLRKNALLSSQLNESLVRQKNGDPEIERFLKAQLSSERKVQDAVAQSSGNTGRYIGNAQANSFRQAKTIRDIAADMDRRKTQKRSETNQLIGQSVREDAMLKNLDWKKYDAQQREYQGSLNAAQNQINSGIGNAFSGLEGMSSDISRLYANRGERKAKEEKGMPDKRKGMGHLLGNIFSKRYRDAHGLDAVLSEQIYDEPNSEKEIDNNLISRAFYGTW